MIQTRKQFPVFGTGTFDVVACGNPSILAYVRSPGEVVGGHEERGRLRHRHQVEHDANPVLCVHNLSRFAQPADLDLTRWADRQPVELLGRVRFPTIGGQTYSVTLGPYGFYWFELVEPRAAEETSVESMQ
jgi:maltose alpha-D-glucosyltransferase/alpha-amylase